MQRTKTIYIVDNDSSARNGLSKFFSISKNKVVTHSSLENFCQIEEFDYNACLILDADQSALESIDIQDFFTQKSVSMPIFFISASDNKQLRVRAARAKAAGFFRKPVDGPALLDAINWETEKKCRNNNENKGVGSNGNDPAG